MSTCFYIFLKEMNNYSEIQCKNLDIVIIALRDIAFFFFLCIIFFINSITPCKGNATGRSHRYILPM